MQWVVPIAALALAALAPAGPSVAGPPTTAPMPLAVVLHEDGGFAGVHRWLWYDADGTVRAHGLAVTEPGTLRAHVDIARVDRVVANLGLCDRGVPPSHPSTAIVYDALFFQVSVRCPHAWRVFFASDPATGGRLALQAFRAFEGLGADLKWMPTDERIALPDSAPPYRTSSLSP